MEVVVASLLSLSLSVPQHLTEQLELDLSPLDYMMKCYPEFKEREEMRKIIGRYGLTGKQQVTMETLEDTSTRMVPKLLATNHQVVFT